MQRRQQRRLAIKVARQAAKNYLDCRVGTFLRKLEAEDADAQMAFYAAAEDIREDMEIEIDVNFITQLLELIREFIDALRRIFNR